MQGRILGDTEGFPYEVEMVAINLFIPWAIAISEEGKLYVTERTGRIWILEEGRFLSEPLITFEAPFTSQGEGGLMGIALDPDFINNRYLYVMHSYEDKGQLYNRVVRLREREDKARMDKILIDRIPAGRIHNGGRIKIGPDRKLYITTGDSGNPNLAQDVGSLAGKILRINLDGTIPRDNPFSNSPVYSLGHRNPQGIDWDANNRLFESEHGQSAHDEINIIVPGGNYGWPIIQGNETGRGMISPLLQSGNVTWAPSGIAFVRNGPWQGRLLVSSLRGERLLSVLLKEGVTEVQEVESFLVRQFGRLREALRAEDGSIYLTTSNRDGRGAPALDDDKIIRLVPKY